MLTLSTPLLYLKSVGPKNAKRLNKLGLFTIRDLLFYFPKKYLDYSKFKKISQLKIEELATIKAKVGFLETERSYKKRIFYTQTILSDETGSIKAIWFSKPYLEQTLLPNKEYLFAGKPVLSKFGLTFIEPEYEEVSKERKIHTLGLIPFYKETSKITSRYIRYLVDQIIDLSNSLKEFLPDYFLKKYNLPKISQAVEILHFPKNLKEVEIAQRRIDLANLLILELFLLERKVEFKKNKSYPIPFHKDEVNSFINSLPFKLTNDQKKALFEILSDISKPVPMNRLLQGDVGSGKTIVALIACLNNAYSGYQSAFMVPTEILAWQQFYNASEFFKGIDISLVLLTSNFSQFSWRGKISSLKKKEILREISQGNASIVFGTHSLIQENVEFKNLSLVVIDEQHRFGVSQRKELSEKGKFPHILSMTATLIPRSLALSLYSDLDISIVKEMPKERKVITKVVPPKEQEKVFDFLKKEIEKGWQSFVVCPLIEDSEKLEAKSVEEEEKKLKKFFPEKWLSVIHGKMKAEEKEKILEKFRKGEKKTLISTSVIEVGIDIPKANFLIIESPERFGLAQLHQLRGRIGRAGQVGYCFLFPEKLSLSVKRRLKAFREAKDGFELSQKDLEIRGPGEFLGEKQSGWPDYLMKSILKTDLVKIAKNEAIEILKNKPDLEKHPLLREKVERLKEKIVLE